MVTQKTFRLRGVASRSDEKYVRDLVQRALGCPDDVNIQVRSLADDPYLDEEMMATLEFSPVPEMLNQSSRLKLTVDDWDLEFDSDFFEFTALHTPAKEDCTIDVVAVSGLNGHGFGSFKERNGNWMWLRDGLSRDLPNSRILVYALDTHLVGSQSFQNIADLGGRLRAALSLVRKEQKRPLVLIGHSLGGIIVKEAVNLMANSKAEVDQASFRALAGIILFGVPSQGMAIGSLVPMVGDGPNRALLEALGPNSNVLRNQSEAFLKIFNSDVTFHIVNFYETQKSPTAVQDETTQRWTMTGPTEILVDPHSATNGRVHNGAANHNHGIDSTHSDLVKFSSRRDGSYRIVVEHLKKMQGFSGLKGGRWDSECSHSLAFAEQSLRVVQLEPAPGTCEWFLDHDHLTSWLSEPCSLLWIRGKPGSGKSMVMKALLQRMRYTTSLNTFVASFFIQGTGSALQKTPLGLYRSLLHQLYQEFPGAFVGLTETFQQKTKESGEVGEKWTWTTEELLQHLCHGLRIASQNHSITIIIDALDEAGEESARKIVEAMKSLLSSIDRSAQLRICFSCRHYPQITLDGGRTIVLEDWNADDIDRVVEVRLTGSNFTPEEKQLLQEKVFANSDGVFQWTSLVLDTIINFRTRGFGFAETLEMAQEVPTDLHRLYESLLQPTTKTHPTRSEHDVREQQRTLKLFQWVLFAARPLAPIELQQALALDWRMNQEWIAEYQAEDDFITQENLALRVKSLSRGLIHMSGSFLSGRVQFIHQSVPDFLTGPTNILQSLSCNPAIPMAWLAHFQLSRSCMKYVLMGEIRKESGTESFLDWLHKQNRRKSRSADAKCPEDAEYTNPKIPDSHEFDYMDQEIVERSFQEFPLILYAWRHWAFHAENAQRQGFEIPEEFEKHDPLDALPWSIESSLKVLLEELTSALGSPIEPCYKNLHGEPYSDKVFPLLRRKQSLGRLKEYAHQMVHILAYCGLTDCVERLVKSQPALLEEKGIHGYHALSYAIRGKQRQTIHMLLHAGSGLNLIFWDDDASYPITYSPLCIACIWGDAEVISLMIKAGAKVNPKGCAVWPLHCAALAGHANIIDLLINAGAKVNGGRGQPCTPLHALAGGDGKLPDMVLKLMDHGARLDMLDEELHNPLHYSVLASPLPVFKAFLKEAVAFEEKYKRRTERMLSKALESMMGRGKIPSIINWQNIDGESPILLAATGGDCERLRLLHEAGANINVKDNSGCTPFFRAAASRYEIQNRYAILDLLLQYGADVNARDNRGETPITKAAQRGDNERAVYLLERGAKVDGRDNQGMTPLLWAAKSVVRFRLRGRYYFQMAETLLKFGADVHVVSNSGRNALFYVREESFWSNSMSRLLREAGLQDVAGESSESESGPEYREIWPDSEPETEPDSESEPEPEQEQELELEPEHSIAARPRFLHGKVNEMKDAVRKWVGAVGKRPAK